MKRRLLLAKGFLCEASNVLCGGWRWWSHEIRNTLESVEFYTSGKWVVRHVSYVSICMGLCYGSGVVLALKIDRCTGLSSWAHWACIWGLGGHNTCEQACENMILGRVVPWRKIKQDKEIESDLCVYVCLCVYIYVSEYVCPCVYYVHVFACACLCTHTCSLF